MAKRKIAQILFFIGALSFMARPFLGFVIFNGHCHPVEESILLKIFSKRKPELSEDSNTGYSAIEKKLANPGLDTLPRVDNFLNTLFPAEFGKDTRLSARFLQAVHIPSARPGWLLYGQIII
jgi:hypothetical protein